MRKDFLLFLSFLVDAGYRRFERNPRPSRER